MVVEIGAAGVDDCVAFLVWVREREDARRRLMIRFKRKIYKCRCNRRFQFNKSTVVFAQGIFGYFHANTAFAIAELH